MSIHIFYLHFSKHHMNYYDYSSIISIKMNYRNIYNIYIYTENQKKRKTALCIWARPICTALGLLGSAHGRSGGSPGEAAAGQGLTGGARWQAAG